MKLNPIFDLFLLDRKSIECPHRHRLEDSLEASLHPRVAYPWQEKEKEGGLRVEKKD